MLNDPLMRDELVKAQQRERWRAEGTQPARATTPNSAGLVGQVIQHVWKRLGLPARVPEARLEEGQSGLPSGKMKPAYLADVPLFDLHARRCPVRTQICLVLLCVPLLVLAACGSTTAALPTPTVTRPAPPTPTATQPTPTATPTTAPASGWIVYTSSSHVYQISYPAGWQVQPSADGGDNVSFIGPNNRYVDVNDYADKSGGASLEEQALQACKGFQGDKDTDHVIGTPVELGGQTWFKTQCNIEAQPATTLILEVTVYKGTVYTIDYTSPVASFDADDTTFYTPIEKSFQFLT